MKNIVFIFLVFFASCDLDMTIKEMLKSDYPAHCKWAYVCWKTRVKNQDKSSCEKFAIKCEEALRTWKPKEKK